jgi:hypothetical protein
MKEWYTTMNKSKMITLLLYKRNGYFTTLEFSLSSRINAKLFTRVLLIIKVKTVVSAYLIPKSDPTIKSMLNLIIISLSCTFEFWIWRPAEFPRSESLSQQSLRLYRSKRSSRHKIRPVSLIWLLGMVCCCEGMRNRQFHADVA